MKRSDRKALGKIAFHERLRELGYHSYREYLSSPHWADVKARFRASKLCSNSCAACGSRGPTAIHHRTYKRVGAEYLIDLNELCRPCHEKVHAYEDATQQHLWAVTNKVVRKARKQRAVK